MPKCPKCKTAEHVRRSQGSRSWDIAFRLLGLSPFRCDACKTRFCRFKRNEQAAYVPPPVKPASPTWPAGLPSRARLDTEPVVHRKSA